MFEEKVMEVDNAPPLVGTFLEVINSLFIPLHVHVTTGGDRLRGHLGHAVDGVGGVSARLSAARQRQRTLRGPIRRSAHDRQFP